LGWGRYAQSPEIEATALPAPRTALLPQRSTHAVAAFEGRLDARTRLRIEAFAREDRDVIDAPDIYPHLSGRSTTWPATVPRWTNAYDGYSRGVEVIVQRRSASRLTGCIGYTLAFSRERDRATGRWFDADGDGRHLLNVYGSYRVTP